jgi:AraC family transcriptional regulator
LARVERRLRQLEQEGSLPACEIVIKEIPAQTVLSARVVASNEGALIPARKSLQELLLIHLDKARIKPTGPWFAVIDDLPYDESDLEVELAVEVSSKVGHHTGDWGESPVQLQTLAAVPNMASVIHEGDVTTIPQAYTSLYSWTQSNGYKIAGPCREVYLPEAGVSTTPAILDAAFAEVQCPVERASIPISILSPTKRKESTMEPKIVTKPAFKAVGLSYIGKNEQGEISQMWGVFNQRMSEIITTNDSCCYGLCFSTPVGISKPEGVDHGEFEYVAAVEVADDSQIPENMVYRQVPTYKYAVFTHHGKLDKLGDTYQYIYNTWLPQSGLEVHLDKYDMEVYDERFIPDSDDSAFDIYVAVKE